jgi:hypothetical protein
MDACTTLKTLDGAISIVAFLCSVGVYMLSGHMGSRRGAFTMQMIAFLILLVTVVLLMVGDVLPCA